VRSISASLVVLDRALDFIEPYLAYGNHIGQRFNVTSVSRSKVIDMQLNESKEYIRQSVK
jgi:hypothetical protein